MRVLAFLALFAVHIADVAAQHAWCNSYTCALPGCAGSPACYALSNGTVCASWCNSHTCDMAHCAGCEQCSTCTTNVDYGAASGCVVPTFCALNPTWNANSKPYYASKQYSGSTRSREEAWLHLTNGATWFAPLFGFKLVREGFDSKFGMGHVRLLTSNQAYGAASQLEMIISADPMTATNAKGSYQAFFQKLCAGLGGAEAIFGQNPIYVSLEDKGAGTFEVVFSGTTCGPAQEHADNFAAAFGGLFAGLMEFHAPWFAGTD